MSPTMAAIATLTTAGAGFLGGWTAAVHAYRRQARRELIAARLTIGRARTPRKGP
jgi:hypothetical protein